MYAIGRSHVEAMQQALERLPTGAPCEGTSAGLITSALIGDMLAAAELLDRGALIDASDHNGRTPLIEAAFGGHQEVVVLLLHRGAAVNARDADGWTALMEAASKGRNEMVRLLLSYGADPLAKDNNGWTALKLAARGNCKLINALRKAESGSSSPA